MDARRTNHSLGLLGSSPTRYLCAAFVFLAAVAAPTVCAADTEAPPEIAVGTDAEAVPVRPVRVLLARSVRKVRIRSDQTIACMPKTGDAPPPSAPNTWLTVRLADTGKLAVGATMLTARSVTLRPQPGGYAEVATYKKGEFQPPTRYPGAVRVEANSDGSLQVVNLVDVEAYTACVVAHEVWPTFKTEAYRAQAILARSFVLYEMTRRNTKPHDVSATQGSQVYRGIRTDEPGLRARSATEDTRGIVLTWFDGKRDRLFCTYYSAACGGVSQSAAIFGTHGDIPPLSGGVTCDFCSIAVGNAYRWGPVEIPLSRIQHKLAKRYKELATIGSITDLQIGSRTDGGRPVSIIIHGSQGEPHEMLMERFRLAIGASKIRSTYCEIRIEGDRAVFDQGHGFGHGLGACQWGMEGQARHGRKAGQILRYYFPGAKLTRVY